MEDGSTTLESNGRDGDWYAGHDATVTGTQFPGATFMMSDLLAADPRHSTSTRAAMTNGMGFNDWGENLGVNMHLVAGNGKHPIYDASAYCGLHFFAKVGATITNDKVLVRVIDQNSHPDGGVCGGGGKPCYQYFQKQLTLAPGVWQEQTIKFSELTCTGWPTALVTNAIFSIEFGLPASAKFELWIDDISFLKKPPGGCPK